MAQDTFPALWNELELYIHQVASAIPAAKGGIDFPAYLSSLLSNAKENGPLLREAFGFPPHGADARLALKAISSKEPSFTPFVRFCAQRMYQLLWRLEYSLAQIAEPWSQPQQEKIRMVTGLCEPYLVASRPALADLSNTLKFGGKFGGFPESAADSELFAVLRALENSSAAVGDAAVLPAAELKKLKQAAIAYLYSYLEALREGNRETDDSSNAWWALSFGLSADAPKFIPFIEVLLNRFRRLRSPSDEVRAKSYVPEVYTPLRTAAYTLITLQNILRLKIPVADDERKRLEGMLKLMLSRLVVTPPSRNIYLAAVHYIALRAFVRYSEDVFLEPILASRVVRLKDYKPAGDFICLDEKVNKQIKDLCAWMEKGAKKGRHAVIVYGPSSSGKSFLVEQLFKAYKQDAQYEHRRVVCNPRADMAKALENISAHAAKSAADAYPPLLFIDEADMELKASIFTGLMNLLEKGISGATSLDRCVVFLAGGKHGSVEAFRFFLEKNQRSKSFEKGTDLFNRARLIDLPANLLQNRNYKLLVGLGAIARSVGTPFKVDESVVEEFRNLPTPRGVRELNAFAEQWKPGKDDIVTLDGAAPSGAYLTVE